MTPSMNSSTHHLPQIKIPATYMRGGTSKGVFFNLDDLPTAAQQAGTTRDKLLLRVIGSPDPYGKQTDGMGGATSSTSKVVILSKSEQAEHDVDYLFGQVAINRAFIDWSGNCGNLTAAVGSYAINNKLVNTDRIPENGIAEVRIWQANIKKTIVAHIPMTNGCVQETGNFTLDGVAFPAAEVKIDFMNPVDEQEPLFPTGNLVDELVVSELGALQATMINAGIPIIFLDAEQIDYKATELQSDINNDEKALAMFEKIRTEGAIKMGLIERPEEATIRQHTPKVAFIGKAQSYTSSSGKTIKAGDIDLNVRALSMGLLHHAMMGTAAVAIGTAAAIPGTLVNQVVAKASSQITGQTKKQNTAGASSVCFGHPSGTLTVGAEVSPTQTTTQVNANDTTQWLVKRVTMSRSARILMEGWVHIPQDT